MIHLAAFCIFLFAIVHPLQFMNFVLWTFIAPVAILYGSLITLGWCLQ